MNDQAGILETHWRAAYVIDTFAMAIPPDPPADAVARRRRFYTETAAQLMRAGVVFGGNGRKISDFSEQDWALFGNIIRRCHVAASVNLSPPPVTAEEWLERDRQAAKRQQQTPELFAGGRFYVVLACELIRAGVMPAVMATMKPRRVVRAA